jgi:hypothetical protein
LTWATAVPAQQLTYFDGYRDGYAAGLSAAGGGGGGGSNSLGENGLIGIGLGGGGSAYDGVPFGNGFDLEAPEWLEVMRDWGLDTRYVAIQVDRDNPESIRSSKAVPLIGERALESTQWQDIIGAGEALGWTMSEGSAIVVLGLDGDRIRTDSVTGYAPNATPGQSDRFNRMIETMPEDFPGIIEGLSAD